MKKLLPGLLLVIIISVLSMLLNTYLLSFIETLTIGIILGLIFSNTVGIKESFSSGVTFSLKKILKWGIVLLGVKLNFDALLDLGPFIVIIVISMVTLGIILANVLGKYAKINTKLSTLLGVGSSICGASAIVAMGPVIDAEEEDVAISVAVISLLGAIGVIVYSFLAYILPLSDVQYGIWAGSSLQGVAHALAAAGARGSESVSMEVGTIVKMARVALLAPVALVLSYKFSEKDSNGSKKVKFPFYVIMFIIVGALFTINSIYNLLPTVYTLGDTTIDIIWLIKKTSSFFILMAMVAMGLKVNFKSFKSKGLKALYTTSILFVLISAISYGFVQFIK